MRILHCADIHLDSKMNSNFDQIKSSERRYELLLSFKKMVGYAADHGVQAVIIAGDLFDSGSISRTTISEVEACIKQYPAIKFFYLKGNHDERDGLNYDTIPNLYVFGEDWTYYDADEKNGTVIAGALCPTNPPMLREDAVNIVVLHGQVAETGAGDVINLADYRHHSIDYMALGHIHKFVMKRLDDRGDYCYSGCLEARGFDEYEEHGFVILDIDDKKQITKKFVKWGRRQVHKVTVDISGCMDNLDCMKEIHNALEQVKADSDDMVEVILTGELSEFMKISQTYILSQLSDEYYLARLKDNTKIKIDISEYTKEISLKSEFIRMVMEDDSLDEETKTEIIKTGLLALAGEAI